MASIVRSIFALFVIALFTSLPIDAQSPHQLLDLAGYPLVRSTKLYTPAVGQRASIVVNVKHLAMERTRSLPNFFCDMAIRRSLLQIKSGRPMWRPIIKEILVRVRFVDWREDYKTLRIGSRRAKKHFFEIGNKGLRSGGEFGGLLSTVRQMEFRWFGAASLDNKPVYVFSVSVDKVVGSRIQRNDRPRGVPFQGGRVAWQGIICIDAESNHALAIALEAVNIPRSFGVDRALQSVVFSDVHLDGREFLLPIASESIADNRDSQTMRQSSRYRNYRKFDADSELQFERIESVKSTITYQ